MNSQEDIENKDLFLIMKLRNVKSQIKELETQEVERRNDLITLVRLAHSEDMSITKIAREAGISRSTVYRWLEL